MVPGVKLYVIQVEIQLRLEQPRADVGEKLGRIVRADLRPYAGV
jgi:hypothetical protein